jgi:PHD/YefM family antitoxin component YafN of YafNO toxin-antitoxin module
MIMDVKPVSALKAGMPAVLKDIQLNHHSVLVVSKGQPQAVLQDVASYQGTQDAIALLKMMLQSERSVAAKRGSSTKAVLARLRARVQARVAAS